MVDLEVMLDRDSRDFEFELVSETRSRSDDLIGEPSTITCKNQYKIKFTFNYRFDSWSDGCFVWSDGSILFDDVSILKIMFCNGGC